MYLTLQSSQWLQPSDRCSSKNSLWRFTIKILHCSIRVYENNYKYSSTVAYFYVFIPLKKSQINSDFNLIVKWCLSSQILDDKFLIKPCETLTLLLHFISPQQHFIWILQREVSVRKSPYSKKIKLDCIPEQNPWKHNKWGDYQSLVWFWSLFISPHQSLNPLFPLNPLPADADEGFNGTFLSFSLVSEFRTDKNNVRYWSLTSMSVMSLFHLMISLLTILITIISKIAFQK